jgi:hypothetical protein
MQEKKAYIQGKKFKWKKKNININTRMDEKNKWIEKKIKKKEKL